MTPDIVPLPDSNTLPDGRYELARNVTNDRGDGRVKRDWRRWPVIPNGTVFLVRRWADGALALEGPRRVILEADGAVCRRGGLMHGVISSLSKLPETVESVLAWAPCTATFVVTTLVASGHITLDDVKEAIAHFKAR